MKSTSRFSSLALLLLLAGCAASAHQLVPFPAQDVTVTRPDLTRIYIVRDDRPGLQRSALRVFDGETEIGDLSPGTFLCWERPAGRTLGRVFYSAVDPGRGNVEGIADFNCPAGQACYFNVTVGREEGKPTVEPLDVKEGQHLVAERKFAGGG